METAQPYIIGSVVTVIIGLIVWALLLKKSNTTLQAANVDLTSKDNYDTTQNEVAKLSDADLGSDLHAALKSPPDGTDPTKS